MLDVLSQEGKEQNRKKKQKRCDVKTTKESEHYHGIGDRKGLILMQENVVSNGRGVTQ